MSEAEKKETISEERFAELERGLLKAFRNATGGIEKSTEYSDRDANYTLAAAQAALALIELYKMAPQKKRREPF